MVGAAHRGRTLLSSPIAFAPRVQQPFPWTVCAFSVTSGFAAALVVVIAWLLSLEWISACRSGFFHVDHLRFSTHMWILFWLVVAAQSPFNISFCFSWQIQTPLGTWTSGTWARYQSIVFVSLSRGARWTPPVLQVLPVYPALIFTFPMMNFDFTAAPSDLQGSPTGLMDEASDLDAWDCNQVAEGFDSFQPGLDEGMLQLHRTSFEKPEEPLIPTAKGFRARWKAKSQARQEEVSMLGDDVSNSQHDSMSLCSWQMMEPENKRQRTQKEVDTRLHDVSDTVGPMQLQNIARLSSLEAMQRFRNHDIKMPWEKGPLAPVFGGPMPSMTPSASFVSPKVGLIDTLAPAVLTKQDSPIPMGPISKFAVKRIAAAKCVVPEDEMLAKCLNQIKNLILLDLQGTEVGVTLCNLAGGLDESTDVLQVLRDCFAKKATATVLKRTSSLWYLAGWMLEYEQTTIWTMTEGQLYSFMCALRDQQAAPTKASHLVEALNFFDNALRFRKIARKTILSPRVLGAAHSMYLQKRKLKQAPQLTVAAVKALEIICTSNTNPLRTAVSGALLFCIFASARWSDFARLENIWTDRCGDLVLVEAETATHKTSKSKEAKTRLLPFTALGRFFCDEA